MSIYDLAYFDIRISVGLWSVCCRFVISLSSGLSVCCRLRVQHCANDRFSIGVMSVIYRSQIGRFHTESYLTWTRLVLQCLQLHCRWPTAGRFIEIFVFFDGFVSVWLVWLGYYDYLLNCLFMNRLKITPKLRVTGLCAGNSPVTGEFPAQRASNTENVPIWWLHNFIMRFDYILMSYNECILPLLESCWGLKVAVLPAMQRRSRALIQYKDVVLPV